MNNNNKQTSKQANKQTSKQANKQTSKQANKQTSKQQATITDTITPLNVLGNLQPQH